jgi:hypothetical protein
MKKAILWGLAGVNALLLGLLVSNYVNENAAHAQVPMAGGPGEYILCPGSITGIGSEVVYVVNVLSGQMGGFVFDTNTGRLDVMPSEDLGRVFQAGVGPQGAVQPGVPGQIPPGAIRR